MAELKKTQMIIRFNDATPDANGKYDFTLTAPIENSVYVDWAGASAGIVGKYVNIAEFNNNGQTTAHITALEVDEPIIPEAPAVVEPVEPEIAPNFAVGYQYITGEVAKYDGSYYISQYLQFSTDEAVQDSAAWDDITTDVNNYETFVWSATKSYKTGDWVCNEDGDEWFKALNSGVLGEPPSADWSPSSVFLDAEPFFISEYYTLNAPTKANPIVRVEISEGNFLYFRHARFVEGISANIIPDAESQTAWLPFTPYRKPKTTFRRAFIPFIPPALPRTSYVAGKYWKFITNGVNSEEKPLPEYLQEPKSFKKLAVRVFSLNGDSYTASENDYLVINTWSK